MRLPDQASGITDLRAEDYLFVNVDAEPGEIGRIERYHEDFGDATGTTHEVSGERWGFFPELAELVIRAHRAIMPGMSFLAWDVAMATE